MQDDGREPPIPCAHDEKHCRRCGGCFRRKCCTCPGAPTRRPYKKRLVEPTASSSAVRARDADRASDCALDGVRCRHGVCPTCRGCKRKCTCKPLIAEHVSLPRAAKVADDADSDEQDEKLANLAPIAAPNPLFDAAVWLGLNARTTAAAKRSHTTRLSPNIAELPERDRRYLIQAVVTLVDTMLRTAVPGDTAGMYRHVRERLDTTYGNTECAEKADSAAFQCVAGEVLHALPPRSREARAILAVVAMTGRENARAALHMETREEDAAGGPGSALGGDVGSEDEDEDDDSDYQHQDEGGDSDTEDDKALSLSAYKRARVDYRRMLCGDTFERPKFFRRKRGNVAVAGAVNFLYRANNTTRLSWGCTRITVGGRKEFIGARNRLRSRNRLWHQYDKEMKDGNVPRANRLHRTAFYRVAGAITAHDLKVGLRYHISSRSRCWLRTLHCRHGARATPRSSSTEHATLRNCGTW